MRNMLARGIRAALLRRRVYAEIQNDSDAILHAFGIVVLVGIASALATEDVMSQGFQNPLEGGGLPGRLIVVWMSIVTLLLGWVLWTSLVYILGTKFLGGRATFHHLLRSIGITYTPGVLLSVGPFPGIGPMLATVGSIWVLVAAVVAVHEAQGKDWIGATISTLFAWFMFFIMLRAIVLGPYASTI